MTINYSGGVAGGLIKYAMLRKNKGGYVICYQMILGLRFKLSIDVFVKWS